MTTLDLEELRRLASEGVLFRPHVVVALLDRIDAAIPSEPDTVSGWEAAMADPAFVSALDEGLADVAAGRVKPYIPSEPGLGEALRQVEAALPEGWWVQLDGHKDGRWRAQAGEPVWGPHYQSVSWDGPTPIAALVRLHEWLTTRLLASKEETK